MSPVKLVAKVPLGGNESTTESEKCDYQCAVSPKARCIGLEI